MLSTKQQMPPSKGPIWDHFLPGEKQNGSHICAHCHGCIEKEQPDEDIPGWCRNSLFANENRIYQGAQQKNKS